MGENPVFKLPKNSLVAEAFGALDLLVVQDIFLNETGRMADVVLPAQAWSERDGTYTNIERRIQRAQKAVAPRAGRTDWRILCDVSTAMGHPMAYANVGEITDELAKVSPLHQGLHLESLDGDGWPVRTEEQPREAEIRIAAVAQPALARQDDGLHLGVERLLFHAGTTSRHAPALLQICSQATAKMSIGLATELGLADGDRVRLATAQGSVTVPIEIDPSLADHRVLLSNHFEGAGVLGLLDYTLDPVTKAPMLEASAVTIEKVEVAEE